MKKLRITRLLATLLVCAALIIFGPKLPAAHAQNNYPAGSLASWKVVPGPAGYDLHAVGMTSATDAWTVGSQGYSVSGYSIGPAILHWDGMQWKELTTSLSYTNLIFDTVAANGANNVWVGGGSGGQSAAYSTEGVFYHWNGANWSAAYPSSRIYAIKFSPNGSLWACGLYAKSISGTPYQSSSGPALFSYDGQNWNGTVPTSTGTSVDNGYHALSFDPANNIWVTRWLGVEAFDGSGNNHQTYTLPNDIYAGLYTIDMVSANDGWVGGREGTLTHWDGLTWTAATSPTTQPIRSIKMLSSQDGWAVGDAGTILHWDGVNWSSVASPVTDDLKSIAMLSSGEGWIAGNNGVILHFTNLRQVFLPLLQQ